MRHFPKHLLLAACAFAGTPAFATSLVPGTAGVPFSVFSGPIGTFVDSSVISDTAVTFAGTFRSAVYRNAAGTLDFFYQFLNTGAGSGGASNPVQRISLYNFDNFLVDAQYSDADLDGGGIFTASNNPGVSATGDRADGVIGMNFNINNKVATGETTSTYIFRTNATAYTLGTISAIDGSTLTRPSFTPSSAVPEPSTWLSMVMGFAILGMAMRRRGAGARGTLTA